ncbi:MAG: peptidylprolyl isomerase [Candidatus Wallbacteria bacterium HGW-Wallbacteria-1]|jgi:FKBP-type peptidyl-prolyl cis-trans isomerase SlyD|uniref:Peptidyl-prolyl cis-trans isomerase n=1 Tax=Candidatus Wallbacteria bacterium HGW-Wallbacteria-1 TaxID=2013854 RepID=A0A2N1PPI3_9BACT|nr:MAG: peptidylprolyl isomerase [Candidatus Wallbacteria bacterium HGW-Wallbacteria-1]
MKIEKDVFATIHYTLTDSDGETLDSSRDGEPLGYIHGQDMIIPGLEKALEGHVKGDTLKTSIAPEDAYGVYDEEMVMIIPKDNFEGFDGEIESGMQFEGDTPAGPQLITVLEVDGNDVTIDCNHPLAGETLNFDVEILDVRKATEEEIKALSACDPEGCGHGCSCC